MTGTVLEATRELMRRLGLTTVFGNPGTTEVPFLSGWPDDFRYVLGLQESVVVGMADAHAQLTRRPVLVNLHSAGGVGHGLGAVFNASANRSPLIVTAGQQARAMLAEEPFLGAPDAAAFPRPHVKWSHEPAHAGEVPIALARAYRIASTPPYGPVFVSIPVDDWERPFDGPMPDVAPTAGRGVAAHVEDVTALADAVRDALGAGPDGGPRTAIVAGAAVDADGAVPDLVALAERCGAAVWAAPLSGRCSFPEDHPLFAGFLTPERRALGAELERYDLVVVLGAPAFTYHVQRPGDVAPLPPTVVVSDDPDVLARTPHGNGVLASPGPVLRALLSVVPASDVPPVTAGRVLPEVPDPAEGLTPALVYATLAGVLPGDAVVVEEGPSHRGALHDHLPIRSTDAGFLTTASGALGYGIAATVGAALARPDRSVVGVLGDGSAMYGIQALWSAAREQARAVFVILDNSEYAAVRLLGERAGGDKLPGTRLGGIDFAELARSMGVDARRVEDPAALAAALRDALAATGPTLLHVPVAGEGPAPY
ncbi:benzoylformate decarboxylase [Pseudonocardia endophytica]|uniref:Benzoylformate decarboxylase n=1 Tax=Pseudonocardia endophytica TaxID=401976 RepID=A0A4R1HPC0_PSEEN|nr:benzoylformate decarboxylase [Pseudonocardia endophytica]TCK23061.1 benzoylformate decarboxylase [Pseudonocardia endophytica]